MVRLLILAQLITTAGCSRRGAAIVAGFGVTAVVAGAVTGSYGDMSGEGNPNDADAASQYLALTGAALLGAALVILISIPDAPKPECGNGKREGGETCDDGNRDAHDG